MSFVYGCNHSCHKFWHVLSLHWIKNLCTSSFKSFYTLCNLWINVLLIFQVFTVTSISPKTPREGQRRQLLHQVGLVCFVVSQSASLVSSSVLLLMFYFIYVSATLFLHVIYYNENSLFYYYLKIIRSFLQS